MWCVCFDCEGVLTPEIWLKIQRETHIEELKITTSEEPNYDKLMRRRIEILRENGLRISDVKAIAQGMKPFDGAADLLAWVYSICPRVLILTDTFDNYALPLLTQLGNYPLFCHTLQVNSDDYIESHSLRIDDQKTRTIKALQDLNFKCIAVGDSFNDIGMLRRANKGFLFKPSEKVKKEHPEFEIVDTYDELKTILKDILNNA